METILTFITEHWELLTAGIFALLFACALIAYIVTNHKKRSYANRISSLSAIIEAKDDEILAQQIENSDLHAEYEKIVATLIDRDKTVEVLQNELDELKAIEEDKKMDALKQLDENVKSVKSLVYSLLPSEPMPEKKKSLLQKIDIEKLKKAPHNLIVKVAKVFKIKKKSDDEIVDAIEDQQIGIILDEVAASDQLVMKSEAVDASISED